MIEMQCSRRQQFGELRTASVEIPGEAGKTSSW